jgi:hypothetical protein
VVVASEGVPRQLVPTIRRAEHSTTMPWLGMALLAAMPPRCGGGEYLGGRYLHYICGERSTDSRLQSMLFSGLWRAAIHLDSCYESLGKAPAIIGR